jgi:hypothetical protein
VEIKKGLCPDKFFLMLYQQGHNEQEVYPGANILHDGGGGVL